MRRTVFLGNDLVHEQLDQYEIEKHISLLSLLSIQG